MTFWSVSKYMLKHWLLFPRVLATHPDQYLLTAHQLSKCNSLFCFDFISNYSIYESENPVNISSYH